MCASMDYETSGRVKPPSTLYSHGAYHAAKHGSRRSHGCGLTLAGKLEHAGGTTPAADVTQQFLEQAIKEQRVVFTWNSAVRRERGDGPRLPRSLLQG